VRERAESLSGCDIKRGAARLGEPLLRDKKSGDEKRTAGDGRHGLGG
jgi:hypothetical protein